MRPIVIVLLLALILAAGCSSSPTAPTPPLVTVPPVTVTPTPNPTTPTTPAPNPLLQDPRFDLHFYRQMALNGYESPTALQPLRRQTQAPRIYLRTIDDTGRAIDDFTLTETAAALINTAGSLTGVFGLAGLEQGTSNRLGQAGWITVEWISARDTACGRGFIGGDSIRLYPNTPGCRCPGGPAVMPIVVKHELGHTLGFWHTENRDDLMNAGRQGVCDMNPSERERFHASLAYSQPIGSFDPR